MKKIPFLIDLLGTGFYLGKIPVMPGTFGSLLGIPIGYFCSFLSMPLKMLVLALIFFLGVYISGKYSEYSGIEDPSSVVIDEVAGILIFYIFFPFNIQYVITGFLLFRLFDILKPFPVSYFDNIKNGWGIMLDDIMAGVYALATGYIIFAVISFLTGHISK